MKALLLAAGYGTRLRPITNSVPKCLVRVSGRPLMDYWLELLSSSQEIKKILINTHYLPGVVRGYVERHQSKDRIELIHEPDLLGTAGTVRSIMPRVATEDLLVAHADNLTLFDLQDFIKSHRNRPERCVATMMSFETDDPSSCGIIQIDDEGVMKNFYEKINDPPGTLANAAVFIFSPVALDIIMRSPTDQLKDISADFIPNMCGRIWVYHNNNYHRDIGTPGSLAAAEKEFQKVYKYSKNKG
jgi:mannose-1-phosphate guanylyltransferase